LSLLLLCCFHSDDALNVSSPPLFYRTDILVRTCNFPSFCLFILRALCRRIRVLIVADCIIPPTVKPMSHSALYCCALNFGVVVYCHSAVLYYSLNDIIFCSWTPWCLFSVYSLAANTLYSSYSSISYRSTVLYSIVHRDSTRQHDIECFSMILCDMIWYDILVMVCEEWRYPVRVSEPCSDRPWIQPSSNLNSDLNTALALQSVSVAVAAYLTSDVMKSPILWLQTAITFADSHFTVVFPTTIQFSTLYPTPNPCPLLPSLLLLVCAPSPVVYVYASCIWLSPVLLPLRFSGCMEAASSMTCL
jgi:hypothetical protein